MGDLSINDVTDFFWFVAWWQAGSIFSGSGFCPWNNSRQRLSRKAVFVVVRLIRYFDETTCLPILKSFSPGSPVYPFCGFEKCPPGRVTANAGSCGYDPSWLLVIDPA